MDCSRLRDAAIDECLCAWMQEGKIGLRWRIQAELVSGKGQFVCGAKGCEEKRGLSSFEVNFAYQEAGESKQALVKLRVCPKHAEQVRLIFTLSALSSCMHSSIVLAFD